LARIELKLLGNASHHAYSFGQANMAKRAIEKLDEELARNLYVALDHAQARGCSPRSKRRTSATTSIPPEFAELRSAITAALEESDENPAL